jgi:hypothetical protein
MPCWTGSDPSPHRGGTLTTFVLLAALCLGLIPAPAAAQGISVQEASSRLVNRTYRVDAKIRFKFDKEILAALKNGVELNIDILTRIKRVRKWLWDPTVTEGLFRYTLKHFPLTDEYVVNDITNGGHYEFRTYGAALDYLGDIRNQALVSKSEISRNATYIGYIKARVDIETLPTPLQPTAYISEKWKLESSWYTWVIK